MNIEELSIAELVDEIGNRCPAGVVMLSIADDAETRNTTSFSWGHRPTRIGLAYTALQAEQALFVREMEEEEEEDEDENDEEEDER